jgi:hypothetical protein
MRRISYRIFTFSTFFASLGIALCLAAGAAHAADVHAPAVVEAGHAFSISADGSGQATFYLIGPDHVVKRTVNLGGDLQVLASEVQAAGRYEIIVCDRSCNSAFFEVMAAHPAQLSFFLHPSRVPVSMRDSIDATAFVFDRYNNLVMKPTGVDFQIKPVSGAPITRRVESRSGVAWLRTDSTAHEGAVRVSALLGSGAEPVEETRVIQQVAAEACQLRMRATQQGNKVTLETDPVRDCSGNAVPDGTIVSFTEVDSAGRSTVDTPIKKGIARTEFSVAGPARISVACGVMLGNEVALGGKL